MKDKPLKLVVPCCYQGGKQRIAPEIVDEILAQIPCAIEEGYRFYDLCCGSGGFTIELLNRGVAPERIFMLDASSWGAFWSAIGSGSFDMDFFTETISRIPKEMEHVKAFMELLAREPIGEHEAELFPILQSASFGGKQIWRDGERWGNAFFRDYWKPTATSVRRSPANPIQPSPVTLSKRIKALAERARGVSCLHTDIFKFFGLEVDGRAIVYVDPPYRKTTRYAYGFDLEDFICKFQANIDLPLFVSEGRALNQEAKRLHFGGAKGGISGVKRQKHEEWLSRFN